MASLKSVLMLCDYEKKKYFFITRSNFSERCSGSLVISHWSAKSLVISQWSQWLSCDLTVTLL